MSPKQINKASNFLFIQVTPVSLFTSSMRAATWTSSLLSSLKQRSYFWFSSFVQLTNILKVCFIFIASFANEDRWYTIVTLLFSHQQLHTTPFQASAKDTPTCKDVVRDCKQEVNRWDMTEISAKARISFSCAAFTNNKVQPPPLRLCSSHVGIVWWCVTLFLHVGSCLSARKITLNVIYSSQSESSHYNSVLRPKMLYLLGA